MSLDGEGAETQAEPTPFAMMGGMDMIGPLVDRFYDLMDGDPAYAALRAMHAEDLGPMRASLKGFLAGWLGGPRDWFVERRGACIMSLHRALPLTERTEREWLGAMTRALDEAGLAPEMDLFVRGAFARMARQMRAGAGA